MAYTTINKSTDYFNTKLYTGTGSELAITGVGFQPDWTWIKGRNVAYDNNVFDAVRGSTKRIMTNQTNAESTQAQMCKSFDSDGFTLGTDGGVNENNTRTYVAWNWKAGTTGSGSTTGSGTYKAYSYSVNTTAGFSIVKYKGNGTAGHTIPHHLGSAPTFRISKILSNSGDNWTVYSETLGNTKELNLNTGDAVGTTTNYWNSTSPNATNFTLGTNGIANGNDVDIISYNFAPKTGYSKFGSYVGNGNADGTFVYTGFKPAWVMVKNANNSSADWTMFDVKRNTSNIMDKRLRANLSNAEDAPLGFIDFTSNGFKWRTDSFAVNGDGNNHVFMAFAEAPIVGTNNIPCTAR